RSTAAGETMDCRVAGGTHTMPTARPQVGGQTDGAVVEGTGGGCSSNYRIDFDFTHRIRSPLYGGRATEHGVAGIAVGTWTPNHWHRSFCLHRSCWIDVSARWTHPAVAAAVCDRKRLRLFHACPGLRSSVARGGHRAHRRGGRSDCCHGFPDSNRRTRVPVRNSWRVSRVCVW